jgi:6-phosphogluconolactonase
MGTGKDDAMSDKKFELISFVTPDLLARAAASAWLEEIEAAGRNGKTHSVALSGGRIAQKFFSAAAAMAAARPFSWKHVHFFWGDERCVPPTDPESNFRLANELLFAPLKIGDQQIHRLRGEDIPSDAVQKAEADLRRFAAADPGGQPVLDLVLLGMGEDGHVASLFPNSARRVADVTVPFLAVDNSPKPPPRRISMSYAAILAAKNVWVLASGAGKEAVLRESLATNATTPLGFVINSRPRTKIFTDLHL